MSPDELSIPAVLDNALSFNIYRVGLLLRRELIRALADYQMTPEQWQVMATLWSTGTPLSQSEIVQLTLKDKHTVSRIIQRLERNGWIEKEPGPRDRRVTIIQPTPKGQSLKDKIPQKLSGHFKEIFQEFRAEEKQFLLDSLKKLRGALGD
jgi:DNA-binding MarR family transcriptional regulator